MSDGETSKKSVFAESLSILVNLLNTGDAYISLSPPFEAKFEINKDIIKKRLDELSISESDFNKETQKISSMLLPALSNEENDYIERLLSSRRLDDKKQKEIKENLYQQISKVKECLLTERLKRRYYLKLSSKAPSFTSIDWDTKIKVGDARLDKIKFPYATCRIKFQREFEDSPYVFFSGKAFDSIQINFTSDDIDYLIKVLETIKQKLSAIEE